MRLHTGILLVAMTACSACSGGSSTSPTDPGTPPQSDPAAPSSSSNVLEDSQSSSDIESGGEPIPGYHWEPNTSEPHEVAVRELYLRSENGNRIFATIHRPVWSSRLMPCHGLVLVPGGTRTGDAWQTPWRKATSKHWAAAGFLVIDFDCQGRGNSGGEEDYNGPVQRGDLKTVIEYCASRSDVLPGGVGLVSSSFGCTLVSATLATYPGLPVRFWVDKEGSHNRYVTTQWDDPWWVDNWGGHDTSDDEFWFEREAIRFQPYIDAPYIRIQTDMDHALDFFYVDHAMEMCNAALFGRCPYSRMNHNPPNTAMDASLAGTYQYEDVAQLDGVLYSYVVEASMERF